MSQSEAVRIISEEKVAVEKREAGLRVGHVFENMQRSEWSFMTHAGSTQ